MSFLVFFFILYVFISYWNMKFNKFLKWFKRYSMPYQWSQNCYLQNKYIQVYWLPYLTEMLMPNNIISYHVFCLISWEWN